MSELDDFFNNLPENQDDEGKVTEVHVNKVLGTFEGMLFNLMSGVNVVTLNYIKVHRDDDSTEAIWAVTIAGIPLQSSTLTELAEMIAKMLKH